MRGLREVVERGTKDPMADALSSGVRDAVQ